MFTPHQSVVTAVDALDVQRITMDRLRIIESIDHSISQTLRKINIIGLDRDTRLLSENNDG